MLEEMETYKIQNADGRVVTVMRKNTPFRGTGRSGCDCRHVRGQIRKASPASRCRLLKNHLLEARYAASAGSNSRPFTP